MTKAQWLARLAKAGGLFRKRDYVNFQVDAVKTRQTAQERLGDRPKPTPNPQGEYRIEKGVLYDKDGNAVGSLW